MEKAYENKIRQIAEIICRRHQRSNRFFSLGLIDLKEVEHECWCIALRLYRKNTFENVEHFGKAAYVACSRRISQKIFQANIPVTVSNSGFLEGLTFINSPDLVDNQTKQDAVSIEELREKIKRRIFELVGTGTIVEASVSVLLDGVKPRKASSYYNTTVESVYKKSGRIKQLARTDELLYELARNLKEERSQCARIEN